MRRSILLLGNHPPPFGGVPSHIEYLSAHLAARGWDVHVVAMTGPRRSPVVHHGYTVHRPDHAQRRRRLLSLPLRAPGRFAARVLGNRALPFVAPRLCLGATALAEVAREIVRRHDLRLLSAYHLFSAGLTGAWLSRDLGLPLVTTIFGEIFHNPDFHRRRIRQVRLIADQSRRLVSCSRHCATSLQLLGLDHPVETVYYGIDTERFSPDENGSSIRARLGINATAPVVLYVARMNRVMGLDVVLQAAPILLATHPDVVFLIAGGKGELSNSALVAAGRWPGRVIVQTDVPAAELPLMYAAATVVVVPSINTRACLGLAIAEGLASGKPVVASDVGGGPEIVTHGETGLLVPPADPRALAWATARLLDDADLRARLAAAGRKLVLDRFDTDRTNRRMEAIFEDAIG